MGVGLGGAKGLLSVMTDRCFFVDSLKIVPSLSLGKRELELFCLWTPKFEFHVICMGHKTLKFIFNN